MLPALGSPLSLLTALDSLVPLWGHNYTCAEVWLQKSRCQLNTAWCIHNAVVTQDLHTFNERRSGTCREAEAERCVGNFRAGEDPSINPCLLPPRSSFIMSWRCFTACSFFIINGQIEILIITFKREWQSVKALFN